ncbi:MAG TPA: hypothetical protein VGG71_13105 [Chitinophagaceae bacterium]
MAFPFTVKFERKLNIDNSINSEDVLSFVKDVFTEQSFKAAYDFKLNKNEISYKINFWNTGRVSDVDGIRKGSFYFEHQTNSPILKHVYHVGGDVIWVGFLFVVFTSIGLLASAIKIKQLPWAIIFYCAAFLLLWSATLFKQNRDFREIVNKIEHKWKPSMH